MYRTKLQLQIYLLFNKSSARGEKGGDNEDDALSEDTKVASDMLLFLLKTITISPAPCLRR